MSARTQRLESERNFAIHDVRPVAAVQEDEVELRFAAER